MPRVDTRRKGMDQGAMALTFEDIAVGPLARSAPATLTREAIIAFAREYDPQPFHLDEAAGAASILGGLAASGWQTSALGMRLLYDCFLSDLASLGSPGIEEVRWLRPVRPGDALTLEVSAAAVRASASRPDRGIVTLALVLRNAAGETVMTQTGAVIVARRDATPAPSASPPASSPPDIRVGDAPPPEADLMLTAFFDELSVGLTARLSAQRFTAEQITAFGKLYDPQPFHVDVAAAKASPYGGLIASGWHTAACWMKHYIASRDRSRAAREAAGLPAAVGGPSPGFFNMRFMHPVRPGDTITYGLRITGLRRLARSNRGMVLTQNTGHAADGTLVFSFDGRLLWPLAPG